MIIDAEDAVMGRLASTTAKKLLSGEEIIIVNADKAVISGTNKVVGHRYFMKRGRGDGLHGPYIHRPTDKIIFRAIRGMIPYKIARGREALKRLKIFTGCPVQYKNAEKIIKTSDKLRCRYVSMKDVSKMMGGKP
ncbi:MAG: 50S ribosomal protein L13 [bacterium]